MAAANYRNTWVEINLERIGYNIQQLKQLLPKGSKAMAVVKTNGYGHGSVEVAKTAIESGIDYFLVALLEEAIYLRENGITLPILVIGRVAPVHAKVAAAYDITLTVFQREWIEEFAQEELSVPLQIHLEFETGMGRTGINSKETLHDIVEAAHNNEQLKITGVYTHFATADEKASSYYTKQQNRFSAMLTTFKEIHEADIIVHTGNSAAGIQYSQQMQHYTRFGIATYGLYPSQALKAMEIINLKPALALYSEIIQVKQIAAGESISYGATYTAEEAEWIGTIPIGYGDGWRRDLQGFHVLVNGKKMPIVGRICMDLMMVKLDKPYRIGEKVTLIGRDGSAEITADDIAAHINTINYEVTCMISNRIPRIYHSGQKLE